MELHENKPSPTDPPATKIVQAFGLRKCPKLVEQLAGEDVDVRINVLGVLCEEFNNPFTIQGCTQAGIVRVLSTMVSDPDFTTRQRSSRALAMLAEDANGLAGILADDAVVEILNGIKDPDEGVRGSVYDCISHITRTKQGVEACVVAGVGSSFVEVVKREANAQKPKLLHALYNLAASQGGLAQCLAAGAVEVCIALLGDESVSEEAKGSAAKTLGFLCFDEQAKDTALAASAIPALLALCTANPNANANTTTTTNANANTTAGPSLQFKTALTLALMAITSTDEGKRQIDSADHVKALCAMVQDDNVTLRLNALKVITNIAVYPPVRPLLLEDVPFMQLLRRLSSGSGGGSASGSGSAALLVKHAGLALAAVNWKP